MADGALEWSLSAAYLSRGAPSDVPAASGSTPSGENLLGAWGWKLLDYPKIVRDAGRFYLLDGTTSHLLERGAESGTYRIWGRYRRWMVGRSGGREDRYSWTVTDDQGRQHTLGSYGGYPYQYRPQPAAPASAAETRPEQRPARRQW